MQQLGRPITNPEATQDRDRGAMAIMIAIMTLVFAALAAFVIDVGALYEERRDLQNGAEAAALAIAIDCAQGINCTSGAAQPMAEQYASLNTNDGASTVLATDIVFDLSQNEVTVTARTSDVGTNTDGDTSTVDHWFARLFGNGGTEVTATASARWGAPATTSILPITVGVCEFNIAIGNTDLGSLPPEGPIGGGQTDVHTFYFHTSEGNPPPLTDDQRQCWGVAGSDVDEADDTMPGGFGWLDEDAECRVGASIGNWYDGDPGADPASADACDPASLVGSTIQIPLFTDVETTNPPCTGSPPKCYQIYGFVGFTVTGFRFSGNGEWVQNPPCSNPHRCISGFFTNFTFLGGIGDPGPNLGSYAVELSG